MRVKICGITQADQGQAIAQLGATALGFICVPQSPRYITPQQIHQIITSISTPIDCIGVFANASLTEIIQIAATTGITGIQLHGTEPPELIQDLRRTLPQIEIIKALRIKTPEALNQVHAYIPVVDTLLLDAYHPQQLGGTGTTLDWSSLQNFSPARPWLLAGGLTPDNLSSALSQLHPQGIDLSSGVERSPGDKDLTQVARLLETLRQLPQYA